MMVELQQDWAFLFQLFAGFSSQKPEAETNSLAVEVALEKLESWLLRK
jgi:hypothetical protein